MNVNVTVPRALSLSTNPAGLMAAAGAVFAAAVMITNAVNGHGVIDSTVVVSAIAAVAALFTRQVVTPVADPKDPVGRPLVPVAPPVVTIPGTAAVTTTAVQPPVTVTPPAP